jgi:hypothetical protein
MIRRLLFFLAVLSASVMPGSHVKAQAFDPNCYFPTVNKPGEIDTLYGSKTRQFLTSTLNIGPTPIDSRSRMLIQDLDGNPDHLSAVLTGSRFDLHHLEVQAKTNLNLRTGHYQTGHFHSPRLIDILRTDLDEGWPRIFWADDSGNFDSARFTDLQAQPRDSQSVNYPAMNCYVAKLTQDTVDDVVFGIHRGVTNRLDLDSDYLVLFAGGDLLSRSQKSVAPIDETEILPRTTRTHVVGTRTAIQGDWRGTGREDLIGGDGYGNMFLYKNDRPFKLSSLVRSLLYDTLWAAWENPTVSGAGPNGEWSFYPSFRALPRNKSDRSVDLMTLVAIGTTKNTLLILRGSKDFGAKRLSLTDAEFKLQIPTYTTFIAETGDISGTGNTSLLVVSGSDDHYVQDLNFYVLGNAIDDKVDMSYSLTQWAIPSTSDTLTADADGIMTLP